MKKLRNKLLLMTLGLITLLGLTVIVFVHVSFTESLESELRGKGIALAKNLNDLSLDYLLTENYIRLHIQLSDFKKTNDDIKYIYIQDNRGNIISHTFEKGFPSALRNAHSVNSDAEYNIATLKSGSELIMDVGVPILKGSLGVLHMGFSENHILSVVRSETLGLVAILAVVITLGCIIAIVFSSALTKPVNELTEAAREIGRGNLEHRVTIKTRDEIGHLGAIFNGMTGKLNTYSRKLEKSNQEMREFLTISSHDLQEPLRKVMVLGDRLKARYHDILQDKGRDYLERMEESIKQMQALINGLITFSSIASKNPVYTSVDLHPITQKVLSDLKTAIDQADAKVEVANLPIIDADPQQMHHLLHNIIDNALKFNNKDEQPRVKVSGSYFQGNDANETGNAPGPDYYQLTIEDNGIGIADEHKDRIFTVCQHLHDKSLFNGAGMGLSVCRKIVENHNGVITVESTSGKGTIFSVSLPVKQIDKNNIAVH